MIIKKDLPEEKILVSACLAGQQCRWDGGTNLIPEIRELVDRGKAVTACPEVLGGLPTPRLPSECRGDSVVNRAGEDVTDAFLRGAKETLRICRENRCRTAVMKAKSPSCGKDVIHDGSFDGNLISGSGVTVRLLTENGINVFTEDEWMERK